jgi:hypothetical protein
MLMNIKSNDFTNYHHTDMLVALENSGIHYSTPLQPTPETIHGLVTKIKHAETKAWTNMY